MNFDFWKGEIIFHKPQVSLLSPWGLEMINFMEGMVVASMYPASKLVVINGDVFQSAIIHKLLLYISYFNVCEARSQCFSSSSTRLYM